MRTAAMGDIIIVADMAGDRPAIVTKVFSANSVEACMFAPMPEYVKVASIHADRREAISAGFSRPAVQHAYWKQ
jgi:hypothetical protein